MSSVCTVQVQDLFFALPVAAIQEVIRAPRLTRVPLAKPVIAGLTNLRGSVVTVIDLGHALSLSSASPRGAMSVVLKERNGAFSLLVDKVGDVVETSEQELDVLPETVSPEVRALVAGAWELDGRLVMLLDEQKIVRGLLEKGAGT